MKNQINKAYKFRFYPQDDLKVLLAKTFGCVRFVYNQTLDFSDKHYNNKTNNVNCGNINHGLKLSEREWTCPNCHAHHDRDENACINLYNYEESFVNLGCKNSHIAGTATNARGGNVRPKASRKAISKKSKAVSNEAGIPCL